MRAWRNGRRAGLRNQCLARVGSSPTARTIFQTHIAAPAKHLQAIMMLWLKPGASFRSEGIRGNGKGNQSNIKEITTMTNAQKISSIDIRIALLQSRNADNGRIVKKLERQKRKLLASDNK